MDYNQKDDNCVPGPNTFNRNQRRTCDVCPAQYLQLKCDKRKDDTKLSRYNHDLISFQWSGLCLCLHFLSMCSCWKCLFSSNCDWIMIFFYLTSEIYNVCLCMHWVTHLAPNHNVCIITAKVEAVWVFSSSVLQLSSDMNHLIPLYFSVLNDKLFCSNYFSSMILHRIIQHTFVSWRHKSLTVPSNQKGVSRNRCHSMTRTITDCQSFDLPILFFCMCTV